MDVTTSRTVQKLGRMMRRIDEALTAAVAVPYRVDGLPWSQTFSPVGEPYSGDANVEGNALSYSRRPEGCGLERRGSISPMGPPRADRSSAISIQSPAAILEQATFMREAFFSRSSERNERALTELCVGRTLSGRPSIIAGRQGYPITSMMTQKIKLRPVKAFVMEYEFAADRRGRATSPNSAAMSAPRVGLAILAQGLLATWRCVFGSPGRTAVVERLLGRSPVLKIGAKVCEARSIGWAGP
ncbi:hypothetical protein [Bradyrhizobium cosmicum]|uniref:hypothetical protein n=1 Tax=Bradyrhizobium cosmicum TaxID=1404864 RepID=UPI0028E5A038|nr:hypothetical protein [Bradyrhizobium cosmicum]